MYKIWLDNIPKTDRKYFKEELVKKEGRLNIYFAPENKALIEVTEPYIITEEWLSIKAEIKRNIEEFIHDFRVYQFERNK